MNLCAYINLYARLICTNTTYQKIFTRHTINMHNSRILARFQASQLHGSQNPQLFQPDKCDHPGGPWVIHQGALEALEEVAEALRSAGLLGRRSDVMDVTEGSMKLGTHFFGDVKGVMNLSCFFLAGGSKKKIKWCKTIANLWSILEGFVAFSFGMCLGW